MRVELKGLRAKVDSGKLVADFDSVFTPFKDHPEIKVHCTYLRNGEALKYMDRDSGTTNIERLFLDKVRKIEGLSVCIGGEEVPVTPQIIADMPVLSMDDDPELIISRLQLLSVTHILNSDALTEDEVKNSD